MIRKLVIGLVMVFIFCSSQAMCALVDLHQEQENLINQNISEYMIGKQLYRDLGLDEIKKTASTELEKEKLDKLEQLAVNGDKEAMRRFYGFKRYLRKKECSKKNNKDISKKISDNYNCGKQLYQDLGLDEIKKVALTELEKEELAKLEKRKLDELEQLAVNGDEEAMRRFYGFKEYLRQKEYNKKNNKKKISCEQNDQLGVALNDALKNTKQQAIKDEFMDLLRNIPQWDIFEGVITEELNKTDTTTYEEKFAAIRTLFKKQIGMSGVICEMSEMFKREAGEIHDADSLKAIKKITEKFQKERNRMKFSMEGISYVSGKE